MKIEKLPSGSYRIRKMYKGQTYTVIFDCKPTQKEAMQAMAKEFDKIQKKHESLTFRAAAEEYIKSKRNVLSPSTIRGYAGIMRQIPENFLGKNIHDITAMDVQMEVNRISKNHSPKTVRNHHGFISSVLGTFCPNLKIFVPPFRKKPRMSRISPLTRILKKYWIVQIELHMKYQSSLPATGCGVPKYAP